jgi:SET domain
MSLESHLQEWESRGGQKWEDINLVARGTKEYSGTDLNEETLREMFGKVFTFNLISAAVTDRFQLLVNCFTMVSSCYDPLGLILHPLAALANHSCSQNAFLRFDRDYEGHRLSIHALRPIVRGEQVVVSYIDATNPVHVRQKELQDRYFFTCECSKCSNALIRKEEIPVPLASDDHLLIEQRAFDLLASAQKDTSISGPIQKLQYGIHILRKTHTWPLHRQPLASLRQQLVVSLIAAGQLHLAFVHAWIQYRSIDPKLMPELHHPIRLVHQWLVFALVQRIVFEYYGRDSSDQKYNVLDRGIKLSTILYYVLYNLYQRVKNDDSSSSFAQMVRRSKYALLGRGSSRLDRVTQTEFNDESDKLKVCATEILGKELVWGDSKA